MLKTENGTTTITCDKCNTQTSAIESEYNEVFFKEGWGLYPHARKYTHLCSQCQPSRAIKARAFVAKNFPFSNK
jgi:hypothetical protein